MPKKKLKIRYDRIILTLIFTFFLGFFFVKLFTRNLKNIYILGNKYLSDQAIIEASNLEDYPKMLKINIENIKEELIKNPYIDSVEVIKNYNEIIIEVGEARPLYFDGTSSLTVLTNGKTVEDIYTLPILLNYVPDTISKDFISSLSLIDEEILAKISEIKYDPNIDSERFLLTMTDGNYVYVNIKRFNLLNNYVTIVSNFKDQKGIFYLDSGSHFELFKKS